MIKKEQKGFLEFVYKNFQGIKDQDITLAYEGEMNHQVMKAFTETAVGKLSKKSVPQNIQNQVYHVMVECLQNISKHAFHTDSKTGTKLNHGILLLTNSEKSYHIITGNVIVKEKISRLNEFLEKINAMGRPELDKLYKKQLMEGTLSHKGGAGLGFIDIRRKTGHELEFHFLELDKVHSFFLLTSTIERNI